MERIKKKKKILEGFLGFFAFSKQLLFFALVRGVRRKDWRGERGKIRAIGRGRGWEESFKPATSA